MKALKRVLAVLTIVILAAIILPWFIFPVLNDIKANSLKNELQNAPLPQNTRIVEVLAGSGNTGGTGDHTEIWAIILIKTQLSEGEIMKFYNGNVQKVDASEQSTFIMRQLGKEFLKLHGVSKFDGYYIVERVDNAVSSFFDIRGC